MASRCGVRAGEISLITISPKEYLRTSFRPDRDFIDGEVLEWNAAQRGLGTRRQRSPNSARKSRPSEIRIPDIVVARIPISDEEVFTSALYLCVEVISLEDIVSACRNGSTNISNSVFPTFGNRSVEALRWRVKAEGWGGAASDGIMRSEDGQVAMALVDVYLP